MNQIQTWKSPHSEPRSLVLAKEKGTYSLSVHKNVVTRSSVEVIERICGANMSMSLLAKSIGYPSLHEIKEYRGYEECCAMVYLVINSALKSASFEKVIGVNEQKMLASVVVDEFGSMTLPEINGAMQRGIAGVYGVIYYDAIRQDTIIGWLDGFIAKHRPEAQAALEELRQGAIRSSEQESLVSAPEANPERLAELKSQIKQMDIERKREALAKSRSKQSRNPSFNEWSDFCSHYRISSMKATAYLESLRSEKVMALGKDRITILRMMWMRDYEKNNQL